MKTKLYLKTIIIKKKFKIKNSGTSSKRQMEDNLNYKQKYIDFFAEKLTAVDNFDGLSINNGFF